MRSLRALLLALAFCVLGAPTSFARQGDARPSKPEKVERDADRKIDLDAARRRWERLSPEEQARLRERYEKLRAMGEAERRDLERHRKHLDRVRRRLIERLDTAERARLNKLPKDEREKLLGEMVEDELRGQARRLEEKLPEGWRARLKQAKPEDRQRFFEDFKRQVRREWGPRAFESLGTQLGVSPERVETWKALPAEQQRELLLELAKRQRRLQVAEHGLPQGVDPAEWEQLQGLPPERFFEEAMRLRESKGWEPGRPFFGPPPEAGPDAWREGARRFRSASRRRPEDRLEFAHLSPEERHRKVDQRRRERLIGAVRDSGLVSPEQLEELRDLPEDRFWARARAWNEELGLGLGRGRGGRKGEAGRRPRGPREDRPPAGERDRRPPPPERGGDAEGRPRRGRAGDPPPPAPPDRAKRAKDAERPPRRRAEDGQRERRGRSD